MFTVKENHISLAVSEILQYTQTHTLFLLNKICRLFLLYKVVRLFV